MAVPLLVLGDKGMKLRQRRHAGTQSFEALCAAMVHGFPRWGMALLALHVRRAWCPLRYDSIQFQPVGFHAVSRRRVPKVLIPHRTGLIDTR